MENPRCFFCLKSCEEICKHCKNVYFCCKEHETIHRPETFCFPFLVQESDTVGRFVVASRDIKASEMILYDSPAVIGPKSSTDPVCLQCLKKWTGVSTCSFCGWPMCDEKCQNGKTHAIECNILAKKKICTIDDVTTESFRIVTPLRLLLIQKSNPELVDRLNYLMDHTKERRQNVELWNSHMEFVEKLKSEYQLEDVTDDNIHRAVGLLWTNAFECCKGGGQALFPTFSLLSHSCSANACHVVFSNSHLVLQAKTDIKAGEEITINYISAVQGKLRRRIKLRDKWFFTCNCLRCKDPSENGSNSSTLICQKSGCGGFLTQEETDRVDGDYVCQKCGGHLQPSEVLKLENEIIKSFQKVSSEQDLEKASKTLLEYESVIHPNHYISLIAKRHILACGRSKVQSLTISELKERLDVCQQVSDVLQKIDPGYSLELGSILNQMAETTKFLARKQYQEQQIDEEQLQKMVQKSLNFFNEYQKCIILSFKKE